MEFRLQGRHRHHGRRVPLPSGHAHFRGIAYNRNVGNSDRGSKMSQTGYTLRIAGKNQVTLPREIVTALNLQKGDELQIVVNTPSDIRLVPYTRVRKDLMTPEIERLLERRRQEDKAGADMVPFEEVLKKAAVKNARRRASASLRGRTKVKMQRKANASEK